MKNAEATEYQVLATDECAASASLFWQGLTNSALLQVARVDTCSGHAFSAYTLYREGSMTFETSAKLLVIHPDPSPEFVLRDVLADHAFLNAMLEPMRAQVKRHFAARHR